MRFGPLVCLTVLAACGSNEAPESPGVTKQTRVTVTPQQTVDLTRQQTIYAVDFMAPRKRVWNAVMASQTALGIPAAKIDDGTGTLVFLLQDRTGKVVGRPASAIVDCGMGAAGPRADSYRLTIRISQKIESLAENHTRISTLVEAWARSPGLSMDRIECSSIGTLERHMVGLISANLQP